MGNSGDPGLMPVVRDRLTDPSALVRGAAVWAARRLSSPATFAVLQATLAGTETDQAVQAEWMAP